MSVSTLLLYHTPWVSVWWTTVTSQPPLSSNKIRHDVHCDGLPDASNTSVYFGKRQGFYVHSVKWLKTPINLTNKVDAGAIWKHIWVTDCAQVAYPHLQCRKWGKNFSEWLRITKIITVDSLVWHIERVLWSPSKEWQLLLYLFHRTESVIQQAPSRHFQHFLWPHRSALV